MRRNLRSLLRQGDPAGDRGVSEVLPVNGRVPRELHPLLHFGFNHVPVGQHVDKVHLAQRFLGRVGK
jgi:hypothetical protein